MSKKNTSSRDSLYNLIELMYGTMENDEAEMNEYIQEKNLNLESITLKVNERLNHYTYTSMKRRAESNKEKFALKYSEDHTTLSTDSRETLLDKLTSLLESVKGEARFALFFRDYNSLTDDDVREMIAEIQALKEIDDNDS